MLFRTLRETMASPVQKKTDSNSQSGGWNTRREFASEQAAHQGGLRPGRPASEPTRSGEWFSRNDRSCEGLRCKVHDDRKECVASIPNHSQLASESSGPPRYAHFREIRVYFAQSRGARAIAAGKSRNRAENWAGLSTTLLQRRVTFATFWLSNFFI